MQIISCDIDRQYAVQQPEAQYYDWNRADVVPSVYVSLPKEGWRVTIAEEEATDKEILRCLEESGHFDFLNNSEEDIYGVDDGEAV